MDAHIKEQMLQRWRRMVAEDREVLALLIEHKVRFHTNGVETTDQDLAAWQDRIDRLQAMIDKVDTPDA